jgi:hypothetical protein
VFRLTEGPNTHVVSHNIYSLYKVTVHFYLMWPALVSSVFALTNDCRGVGERETAAQAGQPHTCLNTADVVIACTDNSSDLHERD